MKLKQRVHTALRTALRALTSGGVSAVACFGAAVGVITNAGADTTEPPVSNLVTTPIEGHANWGYVNTYTQGGTSYQAYVYTNALLAADAMTFTVPSGVTAIDYLVVAGGGSGGEQYTTGGGGGGAGGLLYAEDQSVSSGDVFAIAVGKGGVTGVTGSGDFAGNGGDSVIAKGDLEVRAIGGGCGCKPSLTRAQSGGSGGGGGWKATVIGTGTKGQGNDGGQGNSAYFGAAGGGGAGVQGANTSADHSSTDGGAGLAFVITGVYQWYAAGGGGGAYQAYPAGLGGSGIGGNGGASKQNGTAGTDGTGAGGGGAGASALPGNGGSGIVVIRYATATPTPGGDYDIIQDWTQPTGKNWEERTIRRKLDNQEFKVVKFTSTTASISWTVPSGVTAIDYLVVAGGGAGGEYSTTGGGGGGAGGLLNGTVNIGNGDDDLPAGSELTLTVGAGGKAGETGSGTILGNGLDSTVSVGGNVFLTAYGGGCGAKPNAKAAQDGGSGGGGAWKTANGGSGKEKQGNRGGKGGGLSYFSAAGGGGAGGPGVDSPSDASLSTDGGVGLPFLITGSEQWYAAGGGGGGYITGGNQLGGKGGSDIGGDGGQQNGTGDAKNGGNGTPGTGSGGGGAGGTSGAIPGKGGDGVIVIRYATQSSGTPITEDMITISPATTPYTGSAITPEVTVTDGTKTLTVGTDYTLSGNEAKTTVGTYTITVTGTGDYTDEASKSWSITKAGNSVSDPSITDWTYGETPKQPSGSTATFGTVKYRYFTLGDVAMGAPTTSTAAGTYKVQAYVEAGDNWNAAESVKVEFTIAKASNTVSDPTIENWTYGATPKQPSGSTATFGTVKYRYFTSGDVVMDPPTTSTAAGTYKVQAYVDGTANYDAAESVKVEFTIAKASNTVSDPTIENWTYGATPKQPSGSTATFGTVKYRYFTSGDVAMGAPTTSTAAGTYKVQAYVDDGSDNYDDATSEKVSFTIAKAQTQILSVTMPSFKKTDASVPYPTCEVQPTAAAASVSYTYWADAACTEAEIQRAALKDQPHGVYYVKATIAETDNYLGATKTVPFEIIDPTIQKTPVTPPSPTSKPYNGQHQTSGIGNTPQYTVTEYAGDHIHVGLYPVTVTLTEPSTHKWADTDDSQPRTVDFSITKADNSWNQPPSVTPTQWWEGESGTFGDGSAKWNDGAKYAKWYRINGTSREELGAMPTTAGSYARVVTVPGTDDYNELTREVGFTIYAYGEKTPVPVPVIPDQDWTGSAQTANVPVSGFYTVTENLSKQDLGTYDTVKLQLNDTEHTQWADGTTAADKTISWKIVKAKNAWTVEPELSAYVVAAGEEAPAVKTYGTDKFGNTATATPDAAKHTWTFTVAGNGNYEGLTKVLAYTVTGTDVKGAGDFTWNVAGSGAWTSTNNWKRTNENPSTVYPDDAAANVTFDSASGTSPITVVRPDVTTTTIKSLTVAANAPDLTLRMGSKNPNRSFLDLSAADSSLTIGDGRKVRFEDGILAAYRSSNTAGGAAVSLGANAELTIKVGEAYYNYETLTVGNGAHFAASFRGDLFSMENGARLTAEGDYTRVGFVNSFKQATAYTLCAKDGGLIYLPSVSFTGQTTGKTRDLGSCWEADNGEILFQNGAGHAYGTGTTPTDCDGPKIKISGTYGRVYGLGQLGSDASLDHPLEIILTVPAGGFKNTGIMNLNKTTVVDAPLGAEDDTVTVGSNVKFSIDLTADILARPNLSSVALIRACKVDGTGKLQVPGCTGGVMTSQSTLDAWYASNFTLTGVNKNEWYLYFDKAAQTLHLRRNGAYEYDETAINGYTWEAAGSGDWDNATKWDIKRVPKSEQSFVRFGNNYANQPVEVDLRNGTWDYRSLAFTEGMDLTLRNGTMVGHYNEEKMPTFIWEGSKILFDNVQLMEKQYYVFKNADGLIDITLANGATMPNGAFYNHGVASVVTSRNWRNGDRITIRDGVSRVNQLLLKGNGDQLFMLITNAQFSVNSWTMPTMHTRVTGMGASFLAKSISYKSAFPLDYSKPQIWEAVDGGHFQVDGAYPPFLTSSNKQLNQHFIASNGTMRVKAFTLGNLAGLTESSGCLIRVGGVNGRFTAAGDLAIGAPMPKDGCTFEPTVVEIIEPAAGFANSFDTAPVQGESTVTITPQTKFKVDLSDVKAGSKFALVSGPSLAIAEADLTALEDLLEVKSESNTDTPTLTVENHTLYLNYAVSTKTVVNPPEIASKAYTGAHQTADVPASDDYDIVSNSGGTDFGTYEVVLQLKDPANKTWPDTDAATLTLPFDITQAKNSWTTEPAMNPPYWNVGGSPGTLTAGAAAFGEVSVTKSWTGELAALGEGTYTATYTVNENPNWSGLSKTVTFYVYPHGFTPVGPEDDEPTVYIWRNPNGGYWTVTNDWACARPGCYGYPANAQATAQFTEQYFGDPVSVRGLADVSIAELDYTANVRAGVTLDFTDHALTAGKAVFASAKGQTFAGGTFTFNAVDFAADRVSVTAEKGATVQFPSAALTLQKGELLTADNATIEFRQLTQIGHTASQDYQPVLTMKGATPLIKNSNTGKATTIGSGTASPTSPKLVYELPAAGFTVAPLQGAQTLTIKNDVFLDIDARALVQPDGGTEATYPLASAKTLTCDAAELAKRATIRLPLNTTYVLEKDSTGKVLQLKVTWHNSGMVYTARDFEGPYDGDEHGITVTVTTPSDATIKYRTDPSDEYTETAPTRTDVGTTTVYFQITRDGWTTVEDSKVITITKPVYTVNGDKKIAVDPVEMKKLFGDTVSNWQTALTTENANGVPGWEAYVLGMTIDADWQSLTKTMIIEQGAESTPARPEPTFKMSDSEKLTGATQRLETGSLPGVSAVKYELVGKTPSGEYATVPKSALKDGQENPQSTPAFIYDLSAMDVDVKFFMIRRVYDFINQTE